MSGLRPVAGHEQERASIRTAVAAGQLPNSLLIYGPAGVGKQRVSLWLAQLLLCANPDAAGPCGDCRSCRLALRLEHPDIHWFFPLPRPKSGGNADRLGDALEEARAAELALRRIEPLQPTAPDGMSGIFLAHAHVMVRSAYSRPAMGARKVFVIGDAEALVPQESSPEAANALLKLLEEPPDDTTVILTASDPDVLLPTIRSRLLPLRLRPLPEDHVASYLAEFGGIDPTAARRAARLAQGSIGRALGFLPQEGQPGTLERLRQDARAVLDAVLRENASTRFASALATSPAGARGGFSDTLEFLTVWLRDLAAASAGAEELIINADATDWLQGHAERHPGAVRGVPVAVREVEATLQLAQFNINPQLALASLLHRLHRVLVSSP